MSDKVQKMVTVTRPDGTTFQRRQWVNADEKGASSQVGFPLVPKRSESAYAQGVFVQVPPEESTASEYTAGNRMKGYFPPRITTQLEESVTYQTNSEEANRYLASLSESQSEQVADIVNAHLDAIAENDNQYSEQEFQRYSRELRAALRSFEAIPAVSERSTEEIGEEDSVYRSTLSVQDRQRMISEDFTEAQEIGYLPSDLQLSTELQPDKDGSRQVLRIHASGKPVEIAQQNDDYQRELRERIESVIGQYEEMGNLYSQEPVGVHGTRIFYESYDE